MVLWLDEDSQLGVIKPVPQNMSVFVRRWTLARLPTYDLWKSVTDMP
jgi:hypothetical protein